MAEKKEEYLTVCQSNWCTDVLTDMELPVPPDVLRALLTVVQTDVQSMIDAGAENQEALIRGRAQLSYASKLFDKLRHCNVAELPDSLSVPEELKPLTTPGQVGMKAVVHLILVRTGRAEGPKRSVFVRGSHRTLADLAWAFAAAAVGSRDGASGDDSAAETDDEAKSDEPVAETQVEGPGGVDSDAEMG